MTTDKLPMIKQPWIRALLYAVVIFFVLSILYVVGLMLLKGEIQVKEADISIQDLVVINLVIAAGVFIITWIFRKFIDRKSFISLGFHWKGRNNDAWIGFFAAPALLGIGSLVLVFTGYLSFTGFGATVPALVMQLLLFVFVSFIEELIVRGYILNNLLLSVNKWIALLISSAFFAAMHVFNPGISVTAVINVFAAGLLLGINYIYTRNLWFSIFFHFIWNFYQGAVLGYEVSGLQQSGLLQQALSGPAILTGEPFGFEGSILCTILIILATLYFAYFFSKRYTTAGSTTCP